MANPTPYFAQPEYDSYMKVLTDNGYNSAKPMGNSWWSQPQILDAQETFRNSVNSSPNLPKTNRYGPIDRNNPLPQTTLYNDAPFGDANHNGLGFAGTLLPIALSLLAPGVGTALGSTLSAASLAGIGGALGGGFTGSLNGGGFSGALKGAAMGGAGGYLSGGGLSELTNGLGLTNNGASDLLNSSSLSSGAVPAARSAVSSAATAPSGGFSSFLPTGTSAGGGSSGGFFSQIADVLSPSSSDQLPWLKDVASGKLAENAYSPMLPWTKDVIQGTAAANPFTTAPTPSLLDTLKTGAKDMLTPASLAKDALKLGFSSVLQKTNDSGYTNLANAGKEAAANYQPFLDTGTGANKILADLSGVNGPEAAKAALAQWQMDPSYSFARDEGIKSLDASAAAKGMLISGNNQRAVQDYGSGLANTYFQQYIQNLINESQSGQNAAAGVNEGTMDAATANAVMKAQKTNRFNQLLGGFSSLL